MAYPASAVTFTTKNAGDTIQPAHTNDLQTEVAAIEAAMLTGGLAHNLLPATDSTYVLGSTSKRWIIDGTQITPGTLPSTSLAVTIKPTVIALSTVASTVALNAALGTVFRLTASTNHTIETVTGAVDGQKIIIQHVAVDAARTLTLSSATFRFGTDVSTLSATSSGAFDQIGCIYYGPSSQFTVVAVVKGY